ncbi:hypothetical protein BTUL_0055g00210 [Botrytis tulipae]|uniref:Uncharacterized protein n=1 Tax=Botrytis tulipae TaxID=87230 RepID=A0A4Z1ETY0_9HELO|nr:hypothetical protein BTUL_0055g00210 [Botrytis tulipae]
MSALRLAMFSLIDQDLQAQVFYLSSSTMQIMDIGLYSVVSNTMPDVSWYTSEIPIVDLLDIQKKGRNANVRSPKSCCIAEFLRLVSESRTV